MIKKTRILFATIIFTILMTSIAYAIPSTYVVQSGDSLWKISQTYGVSIDTIKQLNGLSSDNLSIGQTLKLTSTAATQTYTAAPAAANTSVYVVVSGDSLWSIANKFGTTVTNLQQLNGLSNDNLQVGQTLIVSGTAPAATPAPTPSRSGDSAEASRLLADAAQYLGTPYKYGGSGPGGFDCSGFTSYIYGRAGISLPRTAAGQYAVGVAVDKANLMPADLVFFSCGSGGVDHAGIYVGNGQFIHSSSPRSGGVIYSSLTEGYYLRTYVGARRVLR